MNGSRNFRAWQHWRWSGAGHKCSPDEKAIKSVPQGETPKKDK